VNNESSEILRMMNADFGGAGPDLYPEDLRSEIDALNGWIYDSINNGVYKAGFATSQDAYEEAATTLFQALDRVEAILTEKPFLTGERITEADWRLFTTLIRFDPVYVGHFKCNLRRIADYPNLWDYTRALYQIPGVAGTVNMEHIKTHYYGSHKTINPTGVIPIGPTLDLDKPAKRGTQA
jgi:putative glutathione S-transferase